MDTKSRNIRYSIGAKASAVVFIWLCVICAFGSGFFLIYYNNFIGTQNYFETNRFQSRLAALVDNAIEANLKLKSEENIKASGEKEDIIRYKLNRLQRTKDNLSTAVNFGYYIKNTKTGEIITNLKAENALDLIKKQPGATYYSEWESGSHYQISIMEMLSGTSYEVYAAAMQPLKQGDIFYDSFMEYSKIKTMITYALILLGSSLLLMLTAFIYLVCVAGRREKGGDIVLSFIDRIYTDVHSFLVLIAAVISLYCVSAMRFNDKIESFALLSIILSIDVFIGLSYLLSMIRQIKNGQILKNTLIYKTFKGLKALIKLCFNDKLFKPWILLLLLGYGAANCFLSGIFILSLRAGFLGFLFSTFLLVAFNAGALYFTAKSLLSLSQIMSAVKEISNGNIDYAFDNSKISIAFSSFVEDIQSIQGGLKKAVAEAVKGERMKTDLITNVSHDLKTPLTSIVSYVDLLKKEDLHNQKANEYVSILEEKSARLKQLIEDLVEASKASSGNLTVSAEKVDLHELVMQACGEYDEKIKKAELDIRINTSEDKTFISADGKYMWRIVENLLSNVLKYSMRNSRVYVNIDKSSKYGVLTIKNISAFPLDISPDQITERFVRGDASRTTEGSGLGLSIAQSLTALQGGSFKVEIDGDLFKVMVEMPLWLEF